MADAGLKSDTSLLEQNMESLKVEEAPLRRSLTDADDVVRLPASSGLSPGGSGGALARRQDALSSVKR